MVERGDTRIAVIVGHDVAVTALRKSLPPTVLLTGPKSVGKRTLAFVLIDHHGIKKQDVFHRFDRPLSVEDSRYIQRFLSTRPFGRYKVIAMCLDGASIEALNALLKVMEEPPDCARFLLTASSPTLLTVESRATVYRLGYLSEEQVTKVLTKRFSYTIERARLAARGGGGQMFRAIGVGDLDIAKGPVLSLLKAASQGDEELLLNALAKFDEPQMELLKQWGMEARTGVWRVFDSSEGYGLQGNRQAVDRICRALEMGARPRLAAKYALLDITEAKRAAVR